MRPLKDKISITIDSDVLERIKEEAELDDRPLSQYINLVLKHHLRLLDERREQKKNKK
ncbi:MAG: toxin-antitoxin system protein [Clostridia bacterium]|nr:toxin-antitoxin system protein [Clostridia bacterium]